jgi:hypothetical protein
VITRNFAFLRNFRTKKSDKHRGKENKYRDIEEYPLPGEESVSFHKVENIEYAMHPIAVSRNPIVMILNWIGRSFVARLSSSINFNLSLISSINDFIPQADIFKTKRIPTGFFLPYPGIKKGPAVYSF